MREGSALKILSTIELEATEILEDLVKIATTGEPVKEIESLESKEDENSVQSQ